MSDTPFVVRAYNLGLKATANFPTALTPDQIEYYERHLEEIPGALKRGFVVPADDRFSLINTFDLVVPADYDHATRLASFHKEYGSEFYFFNSDITDANFSGATTKLVPGRKLKVKVFQITRTVTSEDCMTFLRSQNAVLTGAQGASLVYEQTKDQLPVGKWSVSFDKKDALWQDSVGFHRVPIVDRYSDGDWLFYLGYFESVWFDVRCLLCFRDFESA